MQEKNYQNMLSVTGDIECFREFSVEFSAKLIPRFTEVFYFFKKNAVDNNSLIRKLHLGYTAMRPEAFDFVAKEFPWLEEFRVKHGLTKKLNFLETNGIDKPKFMPHIDGKDGSPSLMFNVPILNCTTDTQTYWVKARNNFEPVLLCENGTNHNTTNGATPHLPNNIEYDVICTHSFTNRCALFRSDIYHGVNNNSKSEDFRIMMHWWLNDRATINNTMNLFK